VRDVASVEDDGSVAGFADAADGAQQRGLSGAVGAEQRDDLASRTSKSTLKSTCTPL